MSKHFDEFWRRYPNKAGKKDAATYWQKNNLDSQFENIMKFIEWAPRNDEKWKKGFIPMGSTFVRQERWNDHDKHLQRHRLTAQGPQSTAPDLGKVVEWIKNNKRLTPEQLTAQWHWIWNGTQVTGVQIPDMPPLRFASMRDVPRGEAQAA